MALMDTVGKVAGKVAKFADDYKVRVLTLALARAIPRGGAHRAIDHSRRPQPYAIADADALASFPPARPHAGLLPLRPHPRHHRHRHDHHAPAQPLPAPHPRVSGEDLSDGIETELEACRGKGDRDGKRGGHAGRPSGTDGGDARACDTNSPRARSIRIALKRSITKDHHRVVFARKHVSPAARRRRVKDAAVSFSTSRPVSLAQLAVKLLLVKPRRALRGRVHRIVPGHDPSRAHHPLRGV